ncbi:XRE family transcriptional regulator [Streptomyces sp. SAJ15]|uniref:XRE family transcriptional regulator n=1 Tax=Streptomyces sp. SAJ15 TaxID=2011095 RepID=UPI00135D65EE|nr:XRE family transcriptional regulator [Streptomyces sp. SAJ15]TVL92104.1 hypothetical protein CD790_10145 [Streptomyces sp. SAJ15]
MSTYEAPLALPDRLLEHPEMVRACAARDFASVFRLVRRHAGVYPALIARRCDLTPSRVGEIIAGRRMVKDIAVIERIADGLRIPGRMLGLARRSWEVRVEHSESASPARSITRPDPHRPHLGAPPDMAAMDSFRMADRQSGGGHLYRSVLHYLHHKMAPRIFGSQSARDAQETFRAAAALTEMAGWMAHDSGFDERAHEHFARALSLAQAGEDRSLDAGIMASMSHLALHIGRRDEAAALARDGRRRIPAGLSVPTLSARLYAMEARALAQAGEEKATREALELAQTELDADSVPASPWLSSFDSAALASEAALSLMDIGRLAPAQEAAEMAVTLRAGDRARSRVFGQITLALVRIRQGDIEGACAVCHELMRTCEPLGSVRITHQLEELAHTLMPYRGETMVAELLSQLTVVTQRRKLLLSGIGASYGEGAIA